MKRLTAFLAAMAVVALSAPGYAQNWTANPLYGTYSLTTGFTPDPQSVQVAAGGRDSARQLVNGCVGYVNAVQPDVRLYFQGGYNYSALHIYVFANTDTTLMVRTPTGQWYCNDDGSRGLNPLVSVSPQQSGQYDIWVGTYSGTGGNYPPATVYFTELQPPR